jgi:serine/threonine-protein kinase
MAAVGVLAAIVLVVSMVRTPAAVVGAAAPAPPPLAIANTSDPATPAPTTSAAPTREAVFVGHSSGNEMTVAVAVAGAEASAYICDGERIEAWLEGTVSGEQVNLQGRNGAQLTATLADDAALGMVTVAERRLPFSAAVAGPPAGIYEGKATVDGKPNRIGWIVLPSGRQVGINNAAGNRSPAPALDPNDIGGLELAGEKVEVQRVDGGDAVVPR